MSDLPIYVDTDPCPKCGTNYTTAKWQEDVTERRANWNDAIERKCFPIGPPPAWFWRKIDTEHIEVTCHHCGYVSHARTVDGWERS